jgi:acetolactate decarboxylase
MKIIVYFSLFCLFLAAGGCAGLQADRDALFQISTINALMNGCYDAEMRLRELNRHGDLGIGTFDALDGEMIGLDWEFYQTKADGNAYPTPVSMTTPMKDHSNELKEVKQE